MIIFQSAMLSLVLFSFLFLITLIIPKHECILLKFVFLSRYTRLVLYFTTFFVNVIILKIIRPNFFLLQNLRRKLHWNFLLNLIFWLLISNEISGKKVADSIWHLLFQLYLIFMLFVFFVFLLVFLVTFWGQKRLRIN